MDSLYKQLSYLKIILNSNYGSGVNVQDIYNKTYSIKKRIMLIKERKEKIKNIFNVGI
jgi:hypothetical protein